MRPARCVHGHHEASALKRDWRRDARAYLEVALGAEAAARAGFGKRLSTMLLPQLLCLFVHRLSHLCHQNGWRRSARFFSLLNLFCLRATITPASCIAGGAYLPHPQGIVFHGRAGTGLVLYSSALCTSEGPASSAPLEAGPTLGDHVVIGVHAAVIGAVSVGSHTHVAFRTDLCADAPAGAIVSSRAMRVAISAPDAGR